MHMEFRVRDAGYTLDRLSERQKYPVRHYPDFRSLRMIRPE